MLGLYRWLLLAYLVTASVMLPRFWPVIIADGFFAAALLAGLVLVGASLWARAGRPWARLVWLAAGVTALAAVLIALVSLAEIYHHGILLPSYRLYAAAQAVDAVAAHPLFGMGPGADYVNLPPAFKYAPMGHAHNTVLDLAARCGLPAALLFLALLLVPLGRARGGPALTHYVALALPLPGSTTALPSLWPNPVTCGPCWACWQEPAFTPAQAMKTRGGDALCTRKAPPEGSSCGRLR